MTPTEVRHDNLFRIFIVLAAACFTYCLVFKLPFTPIAAEADHLIAIFEGSRLLHGEVIYRDFFEFTFPGAPVLYAGLLGAIGHKYAILPVMVIVIATASTLVCFEIARRTISGPFRFLPPLIWLFFGLRWFGVDASHRMLSQLAVCVAVLVVLRNAAHTRVAAAGILLGIASCMTQQRGIAGAAAIALFLLIEAWSARRGVRAAIYDILILSICFLAVLGAFLAYFVVSAGPGEFVYDTIIYPMKYYGSAPPNYYSRIFTDVVAATRIEAVSGRIYLVFSMLYGWVLPLVPLVAGVILTSRRTRDDKTESRPIVLLTVAGGVLFLTTVGPSPERFFQVSIPALVLLCWLGSQLLKRRQPQIVFATAALLCGPGAIQAFRIQTNWQYHIVETPSGLLACVSSEQAAVFRYLSEHTQPGDVAYQSNQPYIYFLFDLRNPTRMQQVWPWEYTRPEQVAEVIRDVERAKPRLILWDNSNNKPVANRGPGDHLGPLLDYVQDRYTPSGPRYDTDGHPLQIWERNPVK